MVSLTSILILPPMASPSLPSWNAAVVAGFLKNSRINPRVYDANLEFHQTQLFSQDLLGQTRFDSDLLKQKSFYDPGQFMALKKKVNACLAKASHDHSPDLFLWGRLLPGKGVPNPGTDNPFVLFCQQGLGRELDRHDPGLVIFLVSCPDQAVPAQVMAGFIQSKYPGIQAVALAFPGTGLQENQGFDEIIQGTGQQHLAMLADFILQTFGQAFGVKIDPAGQIPDFTGLPLERYLTPARVFPIDPFYFQDPGHLSVFLQDQVKQLEVRGFIFIQNEFESGRIQDPLDLREESQEDFFNRICCHLAPWLSTKDSNIYFSIQAPVPRDSMEIDTQFSYLFSRGLKLIQWEIENQVSEIGSKTLWKASKLGLWNHAQGRGWLRKAQGAAKFIVNNPNIIHSFEDRACPRDGDGCHKVPPEFQDYGRVEPLPGIPFWEHLGDTVYLLVYLSRMAKQELARLRADLKHRSLFSLGSQIRFFYQSPQDLAPGVLDQICKMVAAGGSVDITHVRPNLEKAYLVAYAMENGVIVGNSSLKHPRKEFIQRINQITGLDFTRFVERGYTSVRPEYRAMGLGAELLAGLTQRAGDHKVFSIISEDNLATQKIALRNQTRKIVTYFSEKLNKPMGVWMPEAMIDTPGDPLAPLDPLETRDTGDQKK